MASSEKPPQLVREVLPPQRPGSGLGVMLVAATAMFFAVASSAFILRARMVECSMVPDFQAAPVVVDIMAPGAQAATDRTQCGEPIYQANADGTISVFFEICPPAGQTMVVGESAQEAPPLAPPPSQAPSADGLPPPVKGVPVGRIVHEE